MCKEAHSANSQRVASPTRHVLAPWSSERVVYTHTHTCLHTHGHRPACATIESEEEVVIGSSKNGPHGRARPASPTEAPIGRASPRRCATFVREEVEPQALQFNREERCDV